MVFDGFRYISKLRDCHVCCFDVPLNSSGSGLTGCKTDFFLTNISVCFLICFVFVFQFLLLNCITDFSDVWVVFYFLCITETEMCPSGLFCADILFNFGKAAGKTVAEQASKLKNTVEEKVRAGCPCSLTDFAQLISCSTS